MLAIASHTGYTSLYTFIFTKFGQKAQWLYWFGALAGSVEFGIFARLTLNSAHVTQLRSQRLSQKLDSGTMLWRLSLLLS
jgi:hypothetical protein